MGDGFSQWEVASVNIILATYVKSDYHCPGHYFLWAMDVSDGCPCCIITAGHKAGSVADRQVTWVGIFLLCSPIEDTIILLCYYSKVGDELRFRACLVPWISISKTEKWLTFILKRIICCVVANLFGSGTLFALLQLN